MNWKYHRIKEAKCSKWVCDNHWVTKFDDKTTYTIGVFGEKVGEYKCASTDAAKARATGFVAREVCRRVNALHYSSNAKAEGSKQNNQPTDL